ncbi:DNA cytosine methyltransferase [Agrobacterium radiobacter]|uniref:DNA cytosine methyltransferase n=1 Tax=Agrobacterium radiobacter TaxID=362 RepID=UPI00342C7FAC
MMEVLDLFSAAAGGWSLGMHRAGFKTIAACENVAWRRALYQENNPDVLIYDDVCTLTADRIIRDTGRFPSVVVGSPPCQDISSANTKGKGVEGERSGLYFEAIRIIGEGGPRWFALENSSNLRTRGADAVLAALETLGYACWTFVVRAGDIGANHERPRSWIIGCDPQQVADADGFGRDEGWCGGRGRVDLSVSDDPIHSAGIGHESGWARSARAYRNSETHVARILPADAESFGGLSRAGYDFAQPEHQGASPKQRSEVAGSDGFGRNSSEPWASWNSGITNHIRLDDGLSSWLAGTRIAVGGPRGTSAASLIVEAFGDAVVPQIPEAIGKSILRTERALAAFYERAAP